MAYDICKWKGRSLFSQLVGISYAFWKWEASFIRILDSTWANFPLVYASDKKKQRKKREWTRETEREIIKPSRLQHHLPSSTAKIVLILVADSQLYFTKVHNNGALFWAIIYKFGEKNLYYLKNMSYVWWCQLHNIQNHLGDGTSAFVWDYPK